MKAWEERKLKMQQEEEEEENTPRKTKKKKKGTGKQHGVTGSSRASSQASEIEVSYRVKVSGPFVETSCVF